MQVLRVKTGVYSRVIVMLRVAVRVIGAPMKRRKIICMAIANTETSRKYCSTWD